jgi:hypothetical protein
MKKSLFAFLLIFALLFTAFSAVPASAADKATVVYLKDDGKGDGSSPENAVSDLFDAYDALDLSKDCTVVVCGPFLQEFEFSYGEEYAGSVTFTSVYGGVDYRKSGAVYNFLPCRFVCWGETTFEQMDFATTSTNLLVIGQHHPIKVGEGVTMTGDQMTGGSIAKAFCLMGGYQKDQDLPPEESDKDTSVTVLSGSKIYIVPFSRSILGVYSGTAYVRVGGDADVTVLHGSSAYPNGIEVGNVRMWIYGNAHIKNFYGCTQDTIWNSFELNWISGTIDLFEWVCSYTPNKSTLFKQGTTLYATSVTKADAKFPEIAACFDQVKDSDGKVPDVKIAKPDVTPETKPVETQPAATEPVETKAPVTTAAETKPAETQAPVTGTPATAVPGTNTPATGTAPVAPPAEKGVPAYVWAIVGVAVVALAAVGIVLGKKKK